MKYLLLLILLVGCKSTVVERAARKPSKMIYLYGKHQMRACINITNLGTGVCKNRVGNTEYCQTQGGDATTHIDCKVYNEALKIWSDAGGISEIHDYKSEG